MKTVSRFFKDERGTEIVEWAIVLGIIMVGAITTAGVIGSFVHESFMALVTP